MYPAVVYVTHMTLGLSSCPTRYLNFSKAMLSHLKLPSLQNTAVSGPKTKVSCFTVLFNQTPPTKTSYLPWIVQHTLARNM